MCIVLILVLFVLQVFSSIYRGFERRWRTASSSTFSLPKLIWHHWSFAWFEACTMKSNSNPFHQIRKSFCYSYCYSCRVLRTLCRVGGCRDTRRHSGCTFRTLPLSTLLGVWRIFALDTICFWWVCLWWTCFWWRHLQKLFLQTHSDSDFPGALLVRCSSSFSLKFPLLFNLFKQNLL